MSRIVLIVGFGLTGRAVAAALLERGDEPLVLDDGPGPATHHAAAELGIQLEVAPDSSRLRSLVDRADMVVPSPGIPDWHPVFSLAQILATPIVSEFDLAREWDERPLLAITGTDGKTTVTTLVTEMLLLSGRNAIAAGNTDTPLVAAIDDPLVDVFVVEASSFRLGHTATFKPAVATWLNFGADHLDVHSSLERYEAAKARIWADLDSSSLAVGNAGDPTVARHLDAIPESGPRVVRFGPAPAEFRVEDGALVADDEELLAVDEMWRSLPHDIENSLAAAATALPGGATPDGVRRALRGFEGLEHRLQLVGESGAVSYYNDSKATAPHATLAAVESFESVVLIAGGQNKGLDLAPLAAAAPRLRAVVAIGAAASEVAAAFAGRCPVEMAPSMAAAVAAATALAEPGDAVLLSPGCASFDWYSSYGERGRDFACEVGKIIGGRT